MFFSANQNEKKSAGPKENLKKKNHEMVEKLENEKP